MANPARSSGFNSLCALAEQPPVLLRRNDSTNELYVDALTPVHSKNATRRRLQTWTTPAISLENRRLQQVAAVVRFCPCNLDVNNPVFCEVKYDVCEVSKSGDVICWKSSVKRFVGNLFPFVIFWILFIGLMAGITHRGRLARAYIKRLICRVSASEQLNRMLQDQPDRVRYMMRDIQIRTAHTEERRVTTDQADPEVLAATASGDANAPTRESGIAPGRLYLVLRTKAYTTSKTGTSGQPDEEQTCSICLGNLQDGMRIGSLSCHHEFHADCLKSWLKRKNHCPLCNERVAELRVASNESTAPVDADP
jgi:Ring finger domain